MRRPRVDYSKIDTKIKIYLKGAVRGFSKIAYYSTNGNLVKELLRDGEVDKRINDIDRERNKFYIVHNGKRVYPFRKSQS
jgi:hypothetical protein